MDGRNASQKPIENFLFLTILTSNHYFKGRELCSSKLHSFDLSLSYLRSSTKRFHLPHTCTVFVKYSTNPYRTFPATDVTTDDRSWMMQLVPALRVRDSVQFLYPRVLAISQLPAAEDGDELPKAVRCSYENLKVIVWSL